MATIPAWKQALLERKRQQELQERQRDLEEENRLAKLPPWKRDLLLKKKHVSMANNVAVINDNMSFGSAPAKTTDTSNKRLSYEDTSNQLNGKSSVTCRDVYNANIANGHIDSCDNGDTGNEEDEFKYQPGIVSKLRSRFKAEPPAEEPVRRRSTSTDRQELPHDSISEVKVITREVKPTRISPVTLRNKPHHDNNNIPNGTMAVDTVDGSSDLFTIQTNPTKDISVKTKVSSIKSVFESDKAKSQAAKRSSYSDIENAKPNKSSVINDSKQRYSLHEMPVTKQIDTTAHNKSEGTVVAKQPEVKVKSVVVAKQPEKRVLARETSDENLEKIRKAGQSWLFTAESDKASDVVTQKHVAPVVEKHVVVKHVVPVEQAPQEWREDEEIESINDTLDDVPRFTSPPETLPSNGRHGNRSMTLDIKPEKKPRKTSPLSPKKKPKSPTSPEKTKPEKVSSPEKKKGFFGSLRKDKTKVKVVEVKAKEKKQENPNFEVSAVNSPVALKKRAPEAPTKSPTKASSTKSKAPPPPKSPPKQEEPAEETKPKVPTSLPATERKTVVLQSDTFHVSPDVPVTNIDDVLVESNGTVEDEFDYDFLDEELSIKARPVKFSSVEFHGAGVKLDKSSLNQKNKEKKNLKIQFEEASPETFEYPSEQSLMDATSPSQPVKTIGGTTETSSDDSDVTETEVTSSSTLTSTPAIGSNALGGYRGKFVDDYKLGSKPATESRDTHVVRARQTSVSESDSETEVIINPADENDTFQWSETGSADILF